MVRACEWPSTRSTKDAYVAGRQRRQGAGASWAQRWPLDETFPTIWLSSLWSENLDSNTASGECWREVVASRACLAVVRLSLADRSFVRIGQSSRTLRPSSTPKSTRGKRAL